MPYGAVCPDLQTASLLAAVALIGCIIASAGNSLANDTEAELGIGGLVLRKNAHVQMRSEDLYVSVNEIRVRYRFYNRSASDVRTVVAFPLPQVNLADDEPRGLTEHEFSTSVDGVPVNLSKPRATVGGRERTDVLKRYGVPIDGLQLDKLPDDTWDKLTRAGVTLKTTYYWEQTFPAKKEITIEHRYAPIVGSTVPKNWDGDWLKPGNKTFSVYQKDFCIDREFVRSAKQQRESRPLG